MARRMLIDASHPEETRVVVVDGTRLEEFDFETASRKPLKGNIYLAKVIRIEPSLQAAFVEYGGNRHGFLAFSEIHPDYYQIPVADRERLIAEQHRMHAEAEADEEPRRRDRVDRTDIEDVREEYREQLAAEIGAEPAAIETSSSVQQATDAATEAVPLDPAPVLAEPATSDPEPLTQAAEIPVDRIEGPVLVEPSEPAAPAAGFGEAAAAFTEADNNGSTSFEAVVETEVVAESGAPFANPAGEPSDGAHSTDAVHPEVTVETLGGDEVVEERETRERRRRNPIRQYKIQEVIKRRQILLVQVVKEERGNKGAALTTYLSLAGRYCVLMPNAGRGGGISRKISNPADRKRMKEILGDLDVPQGMGVILRTAGLERSTIDIKRDYEYLSRLWDSIRELTMRSTAPALIYEEGDLIKRSLRDVYDTDIAQVLVEGEAGHQAASEFMRQLVPHQASKVELYKESIPLFHRYQVESQFDAMHSPTVQLRSGGYIVINPTEALVAIDVNSGRSTKERNIEETALRTNIEAAEEIARQVRLRDLAGLIVVDFIDMEETRHQRQVEHKVKDAMRNDRARIQIGRISAFGLLEMSRQRLRPSLLEHSTESCPHCAGTGRIRSIESAALHALRAIEEEGVRRRASEIIVNLPPNVALYLLNQKRHTLTDVEKRYGFHVTIEADDELHAADCEIERVRPRREDRDRPAMELARASYEEVSEQAQSSDELEDDPGRDGDSQREERSGDDDGENREGGRGRRRRRRRRRTRRDGESDTEDQPLAANDSDAGDEPSVAAEADADSETATGDNVASEGTQADGNGESDDDERGDRRRRRGRRGGRRRRRENGEADRDGPAEQAAHDQATADGAGDDGRTEPHVIEQPANDHFAPTPPAMDGLPVERMPIEHAPFDAAPPTEVEAVVSPPPVEPVVASAPQPEVIVEPPAPPVVPVPALNDAPPEKPKRGWWRR